MLLILFIIIRLRIHCLATALKTPNKESTIGPPFSHSLSSMELKLTNISQNLLVFTMIISGFGAVTAFTSDLMIITIVIAYTLWPILGTSTNKENAQKGTSFNSLNELLEKKDVSINALIDLEFDHEMGKLDGADYTTLKNIYRAQAKNVLKDIHESEK